MSSSVGVLSRGIPFPGATVACSSSCSRPARLSSMLEWEVSPCSSALCAVEPACLASAALALLSPSVTGMCTVTPFGGVVGDFLGVMAAFDDRDSLILGVKALLGGKRVEKPLWKTLLQSWAWKEEGSSAGVTEDSPQFTWSLKRTRLFIRPTSLAPPWLLH